MRKQLLVALACAILLPAQTWQRDFEAGRKALLADNLQEAEAHFEAASAEEPGRLAVTRLRASLARSRGDLAGALAFLQTATEIATALHGEMSMPVAEIVSDTGAVQRALGQTDEAVAAFSRAVNIRARAPGRDSVAQARDLTSLGQIHAASFQTESATSCLRQALEEWRAAMREDPEVLTALEALGGIYRDIADYSAAEELYRRALRIREIAFRPGSAELIGGIDSLAYVYFGQKKYKEADPLYRRLIALWETTGGPEHPMLALAIEKYAEFLAAQEKYGEAEAQAARAAALRAQTHVASMNQAARILLMQGKKKESSDMLEKALAVGEAAGMSDAMLAPPLRLYALLLRDSKRTKEADAVERRVKAVIFASPPKKLPVKSAK